MVRTTHSRKLSVALFGFSSGVSSVPNYYTGYLSTINAKKCKLAALTPALQL